jgi:hypothetical protein
VTTLTNKEKGRAEAVARAVAALREKQLDRPVSLRVFGRDLRINPPDFDVRAENGGGPVVAADRILTLHYLLADATAAPAGNFISFRDLPGGSFYWKPYRVRTIQPLVDHFRNDLSALRRALDRFEWTPVDRGDLGARVRAIGTLHLTLVYHAGDEDFEPEAEILFDANVKRIFCTEDAVVLATRLCRSLIGKPCVSCSGCGMCDTRAFPCPIEKES